MARPPRRRGPSPDRANPGRCPRQRRTVRARHRFTDCTDGELWSYIGAPLSFANHAYSHPGQVEEIWLLDVEGTRLMIVAGTSPGSNDGDIAELRAILDSIEIVP